MIVGDRVYSTHPSGLARAERTSNKWGTVAVVTSLAPGTGGQTIIGVHWDGHGDAVYWYYRRDLHVAGATQREAVAAVEQWIEVKRAETVRLFAEIEKLNAERALLVREAVHQELDAEVSA